LLFHHAFFLVELEREIAECQADGLLIIGRQFSNQIRHRRCKIMHVHAQVPELPVRGHHSRRQARRTARREIQAANVLMPCERNRIDHKWVRKGHQTGVSLPLCQKKTAQYDPLRSRMQMFNNQEAAKKDKQAREEAQAAQRTQELAEKRERAKAKKEAKKLKEEEKGQAATRRKQTSQATKEEPRQE